MLLRIFYLFTQLYDFREKALVIVPSESQWLVTYISDGSSVQTDCCVLGFEVLL